MSPIIDVLVYLLELAFGFYTFIVLMRFLLQVVRADFYNPFSQFIVKVTNPLVIPLRRVVPGFGGVDMASIIIAYLLTTLFFTFYYLLAFNGLPSVVSLLLQGVVGVLSLILNIYFITLFVIAISSWFQGAAYNPIILLFGQITAPITKRVQKIVPPMGGIDFSIMITIIGIIVLKKLMVYPQALSDYPIRGLIIF